MHKFSFPFLDEHINDNSKFTAVVATAQHVSTTKGGWGPRTHGYGVTIAGYGKKTVLWGVGYARGHLTLTAYGIQQLLSWNTENKPLIVRTEAGLRDFIGPNGHVRTAMKNNGRNRKGGPFDGYDPLSEITRQLDAGKWEFHTYGPGGQGPNGYSEASTIATKARDYAQRKYLGEVEHKGYGLFGTNETLNVEL